MATKIAEILELLSDGQWHDMDDVRKRLMLNADQFKQTVKFLKEYDFVEIDQANHRLKIEKTAGEFLAQKSTS